MYNGRGADPPSDEKEWRLRAFLLACGQASFIHEVRLHGQKISHQKRQRAAGGSKRRQRP